MFCTSRQFHLSGLSFLPHLTDPGQEPLRLVVQASHICALKLFSNDVHPALEINLRHWKVKRLLSITCLLRFIFLRKKWRRRLELINVLVAASIFYSGLYYNCMSGAYKHIRNRVGCWFWAKKIRCRSYVFRNRIKI